MTGQAANGAAAAPAAPAPNQGQPARSAPVESPIPRGKSDSQNVADFFDLLAGDPATPNTKPKKSAKPAQRSNATPHDEIEDRAFESSNGAGDNPDHEDDGGQGSEDEQEPTRQRDDDAPPDDNQDLESDAEDESGESETDDDDEQLLQRRVKVKADGKEHVVTIAELRNGYQRHQDYSRKTAEVAQQRTALEQHTTEVLSQRQALDGLLVTMAQNVASAMPQRPTPEQWDRLSRDNPLEFTRLDAAWRRHDQAQTEIAQWRQANALQARQHHESQVRAGLEKEAQRLFQKYPDWKDPAKGAAVKQQLYQYAQTYGITPEQLHITNADHLDILFKAMRYDAAMERAKQRQPGTRVTRQPANTPRASAPQAAPPPRPATPGADGESRGKPKPDKLTQAKARQARTHRDEDSVAAFDALLASGR